LYQNDKTCLKNFFNCSFKQNCENIEVLELR